LENKSWQPKPNHKHFVGFDEGGVVINKDDDV
jgi:hypothetical protein